MNTNAPLSTAILRAIYGALIVFGIAALTTKQQGQSWEQALIVGALSALGVLAARGGLEGIHDQRRAATGNVKPSDVGQPPPG